MAKNKNCKCRCKCCKKEYIYDHNKHSSLTYCSILCRKLDKAGLPIEFERICENCGKKYIWRLGQKNWVKKGTKATQGSYSCLKYCCYECGKQISRIKSKQTTINHYNVDNPAKSKDIQNKMKSTCFKRYGVTNILSSLKMKEKYKDNEYVAKIKEKERITRFKKSQEDPNYLNKIKEKEYNTKKKNHSFNISKAENLIFELLIKKYPDTIRQYRSKEYPFNCDFYIPSLNLYIEYQGTWMHGNKPYDNKDKVCLQLVNKWKVKAAEINSKGKAKIQYLYAIKIWTKTDPLKRIIAKKNNLNLIEFFNIEEFYVWYNGKK